MSLFEGIEDVAVAPAKRRGPVASLEFRRVQQLPRRVWEEADDLQALVEGLTQMLKTPNGKQTLKVIQAAALRDLFDLRGLFAPVAVGAGKTFITVLAATLLKVKRSVLVIPASLREQTIRIVIPEMRMHWRVPPDLTIISYEELSLEKNANLLDKLHPQLLAFDECQMLMHTDSGRTRRVNRYMNERPHTIVIATSGTISNHSILHYWHIIQWALKPQNTPLPLGYLEAKEWANALDERVPPPDQLGPGALMRLCRPGETAREGYRRRLTETPGVVSSSADELGTSLQVLGDQAIQIPAKVRSTIRQVKILWERPDGEIIMEAVRMRAIQRQLVCGFFYRWQPAPPREWMDARREWGKYVRDTLKNNRRKLDTPLQVWNEQEKLKKHRNDHRCNCIWCEWRAVKHTFKPNKVAIWVDDYLVKFAAEWLREPGICWVEHQAMGEAISEYAGVPYCGAGDERISTLKGPIVASIAAHGKGKNLQHQWHRNLVICPPSSGSKWEQLLGRTHRMGQPADTVTCEVPLHHELFLNAMQQAFADARFIFETEGNRQRLLYCDTNIERNR